MGRNSKKSKRGEQRAAKKGEGGGPVDLEEQFKSSPHTIIINRGSVGKNVTRLIRDMRRVMEPFTASHLKTKKKNVLKDFVNISGVLNISHMMLFTKNENGTNLRVVRSPKGPTLTFHVEEYTLSADVVSSLKRPNMEAKQFLHHPLLVMNNFSGEGKEIVLMATMFQNMFPSINVNKVKLNTIRRCVLINFNSDNKTIEFRHYNIKAVPVGMSRGVKKLIKTKVPNLDRFNDVSELLLRGGDLSESEAELDGPHNEVVLPQDLGSRGNIKSSKSAIRLTEIGPRLTLKLIKVEEGVCDGPVLFHQFRSLSKEDLKYMETKRKLKKDAKEQRKKVQESNIQRKKAEKERLKQLSLEGMKKKAEKDKAASGEKKVEEGDGSDSDTDAEEPETKDVAAADDDDDDIEYYKAEVGEEPDAETRLSMKRKPTDKQHAPFKKRKPNPGEERKGPKDKFNKSQKGTQKTDKFDKKDKKGKFGKDSGKFDKDGGKFSKFDKSRDKFGKDKFGKQDKFGKKGKFSRMGKPGKPTRGQKPGRKGKPKGKGGRGRGGR